MEQSLSVGDICRVTIESVAYGGSGVGRIGNLVVFVPLTVSGDCVDVAIGEVKKNYVKGVVRTLVTPSESRCDPPCPFYAHCGGCDYQHILYPDQLRIKTRQVTETFQRIGRIKAPVVEDIIPSPAVFHYRGKAEYHCRRNTEGNLKLGFMDRSGGTIIDIDSCLIVDESINEVTARLRSDTRFCRAGTRDKRCILWSYTGYRESPVVRRFVKEREMTVPYNGFFQTNDHLTGVLVDHVVSAVVPRGTDTVLDCYCGSGLFSLFMAERVSRVEGIEMSEKAVTWARKNSENAGLSNTTFFAGQTEDVLLREYVEKNRGIDAVILDPPREGCRKEVIDALSRLMPRRIVYVSCNPATLARDSACLINSGFTLMSIQPFDMFPHTKHIECVAVLERAGMTGAFTDDDSGVIVFPSGGNTEER